MHVKRFGRNTAAVLAISALAVAGSASVASAKTVKFKISCNSTLGANSTTTDKCTSKALGKGTGKSTLIPPNFKQVLKVKGGTITLKGTSKIGTDGKQHVKGKVTGTGKYKGAKGKFTGTGALKDGKITATAAGTFKY